MSYDAYQNLDRGAARGYDAGVAAERERIAGLGPALEIAFREFVDDEEAADCALAAVELIRTGTDRKRLKEG